MRLVKLRTNISSRDTELQDFSYLGWVCDTSLHRILHFMMHRLICSLSDELSDLLLNTTCCIDMTLFILTVSDITTSCCFKNIQSESKADISQN